MQVRQLYNIETDTLLTIHPKGGMIEVRNGFTASYCLPLQEFSFIFVLCSTHPEIITNYQLIEVFKIIGCPVADKKELKTIAKKLRADLKKLGIRDLIVEVRRIGFVVSNKWVTPIDADKYKQKSRITNYIKKLCGAMSRAIN
jgi:DNA-binding winged helix-turn-helix (wHTH) protein